MGVIIGLLLSVLLIVCTVFLLYIQVSVSGGHIPDFLTKNK